MEIREFPKTVGSVIESVLAGEIIVPTNVEDFGINTGILNFLRHGIKPEQIWMQMQRSEDNDYVYQILRGENIIFTIINFYKSVEYSKIERFNLRQFLSTVLTLRIVTISNTESEIKEIKEIISNF